ncbi:ZBED5 protein, partial [Atractosteus spatula]|nr:ZBED5 protein [Atractosteus spatula]
TETGKNASFRIAKADKPHIIFEEPYLPLAKELACIMCGKKAAKQLDLLPPLKDTVTHRIIEMVDDIKSTLVERIKMSRCFSLQLDESVVDLANSLVYVQYEFEGTSHEDFLFCKPLPTRITGEHLFQLLNEFIEENGIDWIKCVGVVQTVLER